MTTTVEEETGSSEGDFYFLHHQYAAPSEGIGATDARAGGRRQGETAAQSDF